MSELRASVRLSNGEILVAHSPDHLLHRDQLEFLDQRLIPSFESPDRVGLILEALTECGILADAAPDTVEVDPSSVHSEAYLHDLRGICSELGSAEPALLPSVWPGRGARLVEEHPHHVRLGRWSRDNFTSLGVGTFAAAVASAGCVVAAMRGLLGRGRGTAFALGRPPHHHAGPDYMNGYCYLNGTAMAATEAARSGRRVAVIDVDYHHGNGTQEILYDTDILFCSIHGEPRSTFPFFNGFEDERGSGAGEGFNLNVPLAAGVRWDQYREALHHALGRISAHGPDLTIVSLGVDTFVGDPVGRFALGSEDFTRLGGALHSIGSPVLFVMEGGYAVQQIGTNVANVLSGFLSGNRR